MKLQGNHPRISVDAEIMLGKPCIAGTRIPIYLILRKLAAGMSHGEIREAYPRLQDGDIEAALAFAADSLEEPIEPASAAE